jgi:hypothetical protein
MKNRWLVVAAVVCVLSLLVIGAAFLSSVGAPKSEPEEADIVYPRDLPDGPGRAHKPKQRPNDKPDEDPAIAIPTNLPALGAPKGTDVQRAVGVPGHGNLVFEISAISHSPLAEKLMRCRGQRTQSGLEDLKKTIGIDILEDVEQVGMAENLIALGGRLGGLTIPKGAGPGERYGTDAKVYTMQAKKKDKRPVYVAQVGKGLLLTGSNRDDVLKAIDRAEGRAPSEVMQGGQADVRGRLTAADLEGLLSTQLADPQVQAIRKLAKGVGLRMNIDERVAASLDVEADGQGDAEDLSAALKSAVTIGRQLARKNGMKKTAWLLDQARFHDAGNEGFALDVAVPGPFILRALGCDEDGNAVTPSPGAVTPTVSPKSE